MTLLKKNKGQMLIESVLIFPALLCLFALVVEGGRAYFQWHVQYQAGLMGARAGALEEQGTAITVAQAKTLEALDANQNIKARSNVVASINGIYLHVKVTANFDSPFSGILQKVFPPIVADASALYTGTPPGGNIPAIVMPPASASSWPPPVSVSVSASASASASISGSLSLASVSNMVSPTPTVSSSFSSFFSPTPTLFYSNDLASATVTLPGMPGSPSGTSTAPEVSMLSVTVSSSPTPTVSATATINPSVSASASASASWANQGE